jgi:hypothetical protein
VIVPEQVIWIGPRRWPGRSPILCSAGDDCLAGSAARAGDRERIESVEQAAVAIIDLDMRAAAL